MKKTYSKLIKILIDEQKNVTASQVSHKLNVSLRSVKNYVRDINELYPDLISSSKNGYIIDIARAKEITETTPDTLPQSSYERSIFIINKLIKSDEPMNLYDLSDELFISLSSLRIDLTKIKRKIAKFDLELIIQTEEVSIVGAEKNKRKLLSTILYDTSNVNFVNLKIIQETFHDIDVEFIRSLLVVACNEHHYFINDYSLINLVLHITISIDRMKNNNVTYQNEFLLPELKSNELKLAQTIIKGLEKKFHIIYSEGEIYELSLLILSRATTIDYKNLSIDNLETYIGKDCFDLVTNLLFTINDNYYIDLRDPDFFLRFALHIHNLLIRSKNNYLSKNPLVEEIKRSYPLVYDTAVLLASLITKHANVLINDDEIAYIAIHIGSALQAQKTLSTKLPTVLYCPNYYNLNNEITQKISDTFPSDILITHIVTDEFEFDALTSTDLIIATLPINRVLITPVIYISLFINARDINNIREKIKELKIKKKQRKFRNNLTTLIKPELFEISNQPATMSDCLEYLSSKLKTLQYVNENFIHEVMERENMSSTSFSQFAIPHSMHMNAYKTGICVLTSHKPIPWGANQVNLVLLLCFNKSDRALFNEIFEPITMILTEADHTNRLIDCTDYESFIDLMVDLYMEPNPLL